MHGLGIIHNVVSQNKIMPTLKPNSFDKQCVKEQQINTKQ